MNRSYKTIGVITLLLMVTVGAMAQSPSQPEKKYEYRIRAGFNIGGTTPIPLPAEIRGIESYSPTMLFSVEGSVMRWITPKWALTTGLRFETKGMNAGARVKNYQMTMMIENGDMTGDMTGRFTGRIRTRIQNEYITLPILAARQLSPRWEVKFGPYFSYRIDGSFTGSAFDGYIRDGDPTGTKVGVENASYNFSYGLRRFSWGGQVGAEWRAYRHLSVYADLTCSANSIFKKDFHSVNFDMYNLYLTVGFGYRF